MKVKNFIVTATIAVLFVLPAAQAKPPFLGGGNPSVAGPSSLLSACDGGSSVCAEFQGGQTFVTWNDCAADSSGGNNCRYRVYRSTSPITSGNYTSATLIASYVLPNSAQLLGGNPDLPVGREYCQANRQTNEAMTCNGLPGTGATQANNPMIKIPDVDTGGGALKQLPYFSGIQVYTALGTGTAYYAVVSTNTGDASPSYIGSVGPISESAAAVQPVNFAASGSRADNSFGKILTPAGKDIVFVAHASSSGGGSANGGRYGDYWEWFLTTNGEGWQDGRQAVSAVFQDNGGQYPSLSNTIEVSHRDTIVKPDGADGGIETYHIGMGFAPNSLVGSANRYYLTGCREIARILNWVPGHYGANANAIHWTGQSMGAWGGASCGIRGLPLVGGPHLASMWLSYPIWRHDLRGSGVWAGGVWTSGMPFKATTGTAPDTLGLLSTTCGGPTGAACVKMQDGVMTWGGTGGYADIPTYIAADPSLDLPFTAWSIGKDDPYPTIAGVLSFTQQVQAVAAFQSAHQGHSFCWDMGQHDMNSMGAIDRDAGGADTAITYSKASFKLNLPYPAFSSSSIDDDPGTGTRDVHGVYDGDYVGCVNLGFTWSFTTDTSGALNFTVDNVAMDRNPTVQPQTTLTGSIASTGSGSVTVADASGFLSVSAGSNIYALVGGTEIIRITSITGNTINYGAARGQLGTTAGIGAHSPGETILQFPAQPTGPNGGPYSTMTADVTPRRIQGFTKGKTNGQVISCNITPNGGSLTNQTPTVENDIFTLLGVIINATGPTVIGCS